MQVLGWPVNLIMEKFVDVTSKNPEIGISVTPKLEDTISECLDGSISLPNFLCSCNKEFNDENIPKLLKCGHTYCRDCVDHLRDSEGQCGECQTKISFLDIETNYETLEKMLGVKKKKLFYELQNLKMEILKQIAVIRQEREEKLAPLELQLEKIEKLLNNPEARNEKLISYILEDIKESISFLNFRINPEFFADTPEVSENVMIQIYKELKSGNRLLTVHQRNKRNFDTEVMFGEISSWANILYFHCLQKQKPTNSEKFVRFDRLKEEVNAISFRLFLKISNKEMVDQIISIKPMDSAFTLLFIHLCTGEKGPSYKGKCFKPMRDGWNNEYISLKMDKFDNIDYVFDSPTFKKEPSDNSKCYIFGDLNGSLTIYNYKTLNGTVIAEVESPPNAFSILWGNDVTVIDCGISFTI